MGNAASARDVAASSIVDGDASVLARAGGVLLERETLAAALRERLAVGGDEPVAVLAPSGSGKSTFIASAVRRLRADYDVARTVFVGAADGSTSLDRVLSELCAALIDDLARFDLDPPETIPDDVLGLGGLLAALLKDLCGAGKRALVVFDAVNELDGESARSLGWLPARSPATILVSAILGGASGDDSSALQTLAALKRRFGITAENALLVPDLDDSEQAELLGRLGRAPTDEEAAALQKKTDRASPLYLRLLAPRLTGIAKFPSTVRDVLDHLLERMPDQKAAAAILRSVHVSSGGLFASQLKSVAGAGAEAISKQLATFVRATPIPGSPQLSYVAFVHQQARDAVARRD